MSVYTLLSNVTSTGVGSGVAPKEFSRNISKGAFQAKGTTSSGTGTATIMVEVSNTDINADYIVLGTITLALGTTSTSDGFSKDVPWEYVRGNVTAISGTGASVTLNMGA